MNVSCIVLMLLFCMSTSRTVAGETYKWCDCGIRDLAIVSAKLGAGGSADELKPLVGDGEPNIAKLCSAAKRRGLRAAEVKMNLDDLLNLQLPAIARTRDDHFVVVENAGPSTVLVTKADGTPRMVTRKEFEPTYSGLSLLVSRDSSRFPRNQSKAPDIRSDRYSHTFGQVDKDRSFEHAFKLTNAGSSDLIISQVRSNCGCTTGRASKDVIAPGDTGEIAVTFKSIGQGDQQYSVLVHSNDPVTPILQLNVKAVVMPNQVLVSPKVVDFATVKRKGPGSREIYLFDPGSNNLKVGEIVSYSPFITTKVSSVGTDKNRPRYKVTFTLSPDTPLGKFESRVTIETNHPKEPLVEIPVTATVEGDITAKPDSLFFGIVKKGQVASRSVSITTVGSRPMKITKIENPFLFLAAETVTKSEGKEYVLSATLRESAPVGSISGEIIVHTNDADQPQIAVSVSGLIEEN